MKKYDKRDKAHGKLINVFDEFARLENGIECMAWDLELEAKRYKHEYVKIGDSNRDAYERGIADALEGVAEKLRELIGK